MSAGYPSALAASLKDTDDWEEAFRVWCLDEEAPKIDFYAFTDYPADWELEFDEQCGEDDEKAYDWNEYQPRPLSQELEFDLEEDLNFDNEDSDNEESEDPVSKRRDWFSTTAMDCSYKVQDSGDVTSSIITIVPVGAQSDEADDTTESSLNLDNCQPENSNESPVSTQIMLTEENLVEHDEHMPSQDSRNAIGSIFDMINQLEALNEQMATKLSKANHEARNNEH
ncbi:hypothetical protein IWX90DRAFT_417044 [Phyllosticta citrichinensis]|uniref:Uncharacterized protein n=1 Tax=Phyllosticta citrichinensis TaxID=1130410 RepID=A0ABR1XPA5_9PEZI